MSHPTTASSQSSLQSHTSQPRKLTDSRHLCIISRLILALILLYALVRIVCWVVWLILDPKPPLVTLDSLSISNSTLFKSQEKKATYCLELSIRNPNKKISLQMDGFRISVSYKGTNVSETFINAVDMGKMSEQTLTAKGEMVVDEWSRRSSIMDIRVRMKVMIRFTAANLLTRRRSIKVLCENLGVDFRGGAKNCFVLFVV